MKSEYYEARIMSNIKRSCGIMTHRNHKSNKRELTRRGDHPCTDVATYFEDSYG